MSATSAATHEPARRPPIVAIDGPAGAGKSTVARSLANVLGFLLVDTGAMYRAVALVAKRAGIDSADGREVGSLARKMVADRALGFERDALAYGGGLRVKLHGEDISEAIRTPDIGMGASTVSAHAEVRAALLDLQRQAGARGGVVVEGRDIGTVVFPDAEIKFFVTARPDVRARRRFEELVAKGDHSVTYEETLEDVWRRDAQDEGRAVAPLRQAESAIVIDTSERSIDEVVALMADHVRRFA